MTPPIGQDFALLTSGVIAALYDVMAKGQQFYIMPAGSHWLYFYNGPTMVH